MPDFPTVPVPSSISAPEVIDPMLSFGADMGYEVRRARHSRPRYRYTLEWLGKVTGDMRYIRDFLMQQRLGTLAFRWFHNTAKETGVLVHPTTPVTLSLPGGAWLVPRHVARHFRPGRRRRRHSRWVANHLCGLAHGAPEWFDESGQRHLLDPGFFAQSRGTV